jgi:hypothetical protein
MNVDEAMEAVVDFKTDPIIFFAETVAVILAAEVERLRGELERERMRLAACGVVANSNTEKSLKNVMDDVHQDYLSASLTDVKNAVEREIALRAELAAAGDGDTWREACGRLEAELAKTRDELWETKAENTHWEESYDRLKTELAASKADLASLDAIVAENEFLRVNNRGLAEDLAVSAEQLAAAKAASVCPVDIVWVYQSGWGQYASVELKSEEDAVALMKWLRERMKERGE